MNGEAQRLVAALELQPLAGEGGYFRQTWASSMSRADGRAAGTAIYFLLTPEDFSALHRLETDEVWHFYAGDPVELLLLDPRQGAGRATRLGADVPGGEVAQRVVPAGVWQGARIVADQGRRGWALLGCTMAPGWDEREFARGGRAELLRAFPEWADAIRALTRR